MAEDVDAAILSVSMFFRNERDVYQCAVGSVGSLPMLRSRGSVHSMCIDGSAHAPPTPHLIRLNFSKFLPDSVIHDARQGQSYINPLF